MVSKNIIWTSILCFCIYASSRDNVIKLNDDITEEMLTFELINNILNSPPARQIEQLAEFIKTNPHCDEAYQLFFEKCVLNDQTAAIRKLCNMLMTQDSLEFQAAWTLGRLALIEQDSLAAKKYFTLSLHSPAISLRMMWDTWSLLPQQIRSTCYNGQKGISTGASENLYRTFFTLYDHEEYKNALALLTRHASSESVLYDRIAGDCFFKLADFGRADSAWQAGLLRATEHKLIIDKAQLFMNLAKSALEQTDFKKCQAYSDSAKFWIDHCQLQELKITIEGIAGGAAYFQGDLASALQHYTSAGDLAFKLKEQQPTINWYQTKAQVLYELGELCDAFQTLENAEIIVRHSSEQRPLLDLLVRKAIMYDYINQQPFVHEISERILQLANKPGLELYRRTALVYLAQPHEESGDYAYVRHVYQDYINYLFRNGESIFISYWYGRIAATFLMEKNYQGAEKYYKLAYDTAKKVKSQAYMIWYLIKLAALDNLKHRSQYALQKYQQALQIAIKENNSNMEWQIYLGMGNSHLQNGAVQQAIESYRRAAKIIEQRRLELQVDQLQIGYFSEKLKLQVYDKLVACYLQQYHDHPSVSLLDSLYTYTELSHGRSLQDRLPGHKNLLQDEGYKVALANLQKIQRSLRLQKKYLSSNDSLTRRLDDLEKAQFVLMSHRLKIAQNAQNYKTVQDKSHLTLAKVCQELAKIQMGLIIYHIAEDAVFALASDGRTTCIVPLNISADSLTCIIDALMLPFHDITPDLDKIEFKADLSHILYKELFLPIEQKISLPRRLMIIPDLCMTNLPLDMLLTEKPQKDEYTISDSADYTPYFLGRQYGFIYSPSMNCILQRTPRNKTSRLLVFAQPLIQESRDSQQLFVLRSKTGWNFSPLVFAGAEADAIKKVHHKTQICTLDDATKKEFKKLASDFGIIHFATHGFVDKKYDAFCGVVLSPQTDESDDGLLMGYEISDMTLNQDLIALSACQTGCGKLMPGEGVLGLPRMFLSSGVKTVMMTLWEVDDRFTSKLMPLFYQYYLEENQSKVDALRMAKTNLIARLKRENPIYQHPFFWASFALYGDPRRSSFSNPFISSYLLVILFLFSLTLFYLFLRKKKS